MVGFLLKALPRTAGPQRKAGSSIKDKTLIVLCGLPRSGKTTKALELAGEHGYPIVSPDAVRLALHGNRFIMQAEPFVWVIARLMVRALFEAGHGTILVDATNGTAKRRAEWRSDDWSRQFVVIETPKEVCLERARAQGDTEIVAVIEDMAAKWEPIAAGEEDERLAP